MRSRILAVLALACSLRATAVHAEDLWFKTGFSIYSYSIDSA